MLEIELYNVFSACIQYPGFCRDYELTLTDAIGEEVEWEEEDKLPTELVNRIKNRKTDQQNPMQVGWKLEAVDLMDPKLICPATVTVSLDLYSRVLLLSKSVGIFPFCFVFF